MKNRPSSYKRLTLNEKREIVQKAKVYGDLRKVAKKVGGSESAVSYVISGRYDNARILNAAYNLVRGRKNAKTAL